MPNEDYNYIDLFSGIGGFAYGAWLAGMKFKNHFASDIEKYCVELYQKRFLDSIQLGDITKIDYKELKQKYGNKWIVSGGFPCQPHSNAGKRRAANDERDLWPECFRMLGELRPKVALFENVPGLFTSGGGRFFNGILADISSIGYDCEWTVISAQDIGAPHLRKRVWIVAYANADIYEGKMDRRGDQGSTKKSKVGNTCEGETSYRKRIRTESCASSQDKMANAGLQRQTEYEIKTAGIEQCGQKMANTESTSWNRKAQRKQSGKIRRRSTQSRNISNTTKLGLERKKSESEFFGRESRLFTECGQWTTEPALGELVDGLPDGLGGFEGRLAIKSYKRVDQLKALGNSIVPAIAELLFRQIKPLL